MRKIFNFLMFVAVAATAFVGCTNSDVKNEATPLPTPSAGLYRQLTFATDSDSDESRTHHTGSTVYWSKGDRIRIGYTLNGVWQNAEGREAGVGTAKLYASTEQGSDAELSVFRVTELFKEVETEGEATYTFYGLYPSEITKRNEPDLADSEAGKINLYIPYIQSPSATSFDGKADLLVSRSLKDYSAFPTYEEQISMRWKRLVAHGQVTLKNLLDAGMVEGEKITFVEFTTDDDDALTGDFSLDIAGQAITSRSGSKNKVRLSFAENEEYNTLIDADEDGVADDFVVWFATAPFTATDLTVSVGTDKAIYTRTFAGANKTFKVNTRNTLGISLKNADRRDLGAGEAWELMTDASVLAVGKKVVVAAADYDVAMSTTQNTNNRGEAAITKSGTSITIDSSVQVLKVMAGTQEGTWALYDEAQEGYLYAASTSSNQLKTKSILDVTGSWAIEVVDGKASVVSVGRSETQPGTMRYNASNNPPIFSCYKASNQMKDIALYHNATALEQLAKPVISDAVEVEGNAVRVEWNEVPNAIYYTVRCQKENTDKVIIFKNITDTAVVCDNLTNTTNEYPHWIITVTAYADGYYSNTSDAVEVTVEGKTPTVTVEPTELSFTSAGGEKSIEVSTTNLGNSVEIDAVSNNDAFSVLVDDATVTVVAEANPTTEPRSGIITITARGAMTIACDVAVSQAGRAEASTEWQLLTDLNSLQAEGLEVIIAAAGFDKAMAWQDDNNRKSDDITKSAETLTTIGGEVRVFQLQQGSTSGTWAFFDESYDNGEEKPMGGYLYAASDGANHLKTQAENDVNGEWTISLTDGVLSIVAAGSTNRNVMQYNSASNSELFSCYAEASQKPVALYFRKASTEPRILALSVDATEFKYDGSNTITATVITKYADTETLTGTLTNDSGAEFTGSALVGDDNKVVIAVKAMPNEANEPRELTFTVSLPNGDSKSVTLTQEAAPLATTGWSLLTDIADLKPGMEVVITANTAASPRVLGALSGEFFTAVEGITFSDDKSTITGMPAEGAIIFTIGGAVDAYTFSCDNGLLGSKSSTANEWNGDNTTWTLTPNDGNVDIVSVGATGGKLQYNTSSPRFKNYTSSQGKVQIYYRGEGSGEFPVAPRLEATPTSLTWEADATDAQQITVTANGDWSPTPSGMDWATVAVSGDVITVTPKAANTVEAANEGTITISMAGVDDIVVTCSQAGKEPSGGESAVFVLTGENMAAMSSVGSGYNTVKTYTDATYTWSTNGYQTGNLKNMIQLRVRTNSSGVSWIQLPTFPASIKDITFSVTNASANSEGATTTTTKLQFQETNAKDATIIASGGGTATNEIVIDLSSKSYNTGFITASAGIRVWNITVTLQGAGGGDTPATPTKLDTPSVTATASGNTVTVSWGAISGAADYTVTCGDATPKTVTGTSTSFTDLAYSTDYEVSVVANPSDVATHTASDAGTASVTTEADPNAGGGSGATSKTYTFTITTLDFPGGSYAANNTEKTSTATATDGSGDTMEVKWTSYQVMKQSSYIQFQKSNGYIYNSTDLGTIESISYTTNSGSFTNYIGTVAKPTTVGSGGYFQIKAGSSAVGQTSSITITFTK